MKSMEIKKIILINGDTLECKKISITAETTQSVQYLEDMSNFDVLKYFAYFLLEMAKE